MKKLLFITLGLAALFGVTACVEQQNVSPDFNPVDQTINTQFYFNISSASGEANTKQADTNVQAHGNFRGIDNATLFALIDSNLTTTSPKARRKMVVPTSQAQAMRDLSSILQKSAITSATGGTRIIEINLPVGTNELIVYGKAAKQAIPGLKNEELYGSLKYTTTPENYLNLSDLIGSYAERRLSSADSTDYDLEKTVIAKALNGVFATGINCTTNWHDTTVTEPVVFENKSFTMNGKVLHWADYYCASSNAQSKSPYFFRDANGTTVYPDSAAGRVRADASELEKILGNAYVAIANPHAALEIRGGSGASLARALSDLHNIVSAGANATPVALSEAVAQVFFKKLSSNLEKLTDPVAGSRTGERVWKRAITVKNAVGMTTSQFTKDSRDLNNFPDEMNLPAGATTIGLDSMIIAPTILGGTSSILQVQYVAAMDTMLNGGSSQGNIYTYPPELCYYGNSSIRVNNTDNNNDIFPAYSSTDKDYWYNDNNWSGAGGNGWEADGSAITNSTRAIALTNTIQYGMALLASRVYLESTSLTDNGQALAGQTKRLSVDQTHYLDWTGILIGGQPEQVGWNYLLKQKNGVKAGSNAIVYDKVNYRLADTPGQDTCGYAITRAGYVGSSTSGDISGAYTNYTLLFDNVDPYLADTTTQNNVYVALEFVNHLGQDFWGEQGLIRDGSTFYLFAKLMPVPNSDASTTQFWNNVFKDGGFNNHYLLPPYETSGENMGETRHIRRVFVQDIKTGVTFTFGDEALSHAYVSIPDLRSAKISLGMAVDLNWTAGLTYEAPLGTR